MEQDFELASQVKSWYEIESYSALNHVDPRSAADARALDVHENTTVHNGKRNDGGMLWAEDNIELPNNKFSASSIKIIGKADYERSAFQGKVFEYYLRGLRQRLRNKGQRCS